MTKGYMPPQEYLLENFIYIPETGEFTNKKRRYKQKPSTMYRSVRIWGTVYVAHRIIWLYMTGDYPDIVDHINGHKADNHWLNLQNISIIEHSYKHGDQINKCKYPGIYETKDGWKAFIKDNYKTVCIGLFDCPNKAKQAQETHPRETQPRIQIQPKLETNLGLIDSELLDKEIEAIKEYNIDIKEYVEINAGDLYLTDTRSL